MAFFQGKSLYVNHLSDDVAALVLDAPGGSNNFLTPDVLDELGQALDRVEQEPRFALLVLRSAKPASFCHGLDPNWLAGHVTPEELIALAGRGQQLCTKLAGLRLPSVAVVGGPCFGAGLELALACDYRVAVNRATTVLGFTEVELGLIPSWGGTQRLPRVVGLEKAVPLLLSSRRLRAIDAVDAGLADALGEENDPAPPDFLAAPGKRDWSHFTRRSWRQRLVESHTLGRRLILRGARRALAERAPDDFPAPWEALEALRFVTPGHDLAAGLEFERQAVGRLAGHPALRNLLRLRLERDRRRAAAPRPDPSARVRSVGIVGATSTGIVLARLAALQGCQVVLHDEDKTALGYAIFELFRSLQDHAKRGIVPAAAVAKTLSAIRGTATWQHFDTLDLVLDTQEDGQRAERFRNLDTVTAPATILTSTGAAEAAAALRTGLRHPRRVAVLHFAEPVEQSALVELSRLEDAAAPVQRRLEEWATSLGKVGVTVADRPGLLVLRVWMPAFNEAARLLREGMALARIDEAITRFGMAHGPLEMMDRLGLDTVAHLVDALQPMLADRLTLETGFAEMAERRLLGVSTGAGFYLHSGKRYRANRGASALWQAMGPGEVGRMLPALARADEIDLAQRRMVLLTVLEAFHCLREHVVDDADTLDFVLATAGWAPHRGGPLRYARSTGVDAVVAGLQDLARDFGPRFAPPDGLRLGLSG
jgi:3-hydroxyacyl-CoA dehydrogenase/enoyl-CoA hydratase/3-hydroxybutyryl-CoA epimerase